jgi:hypothetical protein
MAEISVRLLETGDIRLLETGDQLLLEIQPVDLNGYRLLETGDFRLLENGMFRSLEGWIAPDPFLLGFGMRKKLGKPGALDPLNVNGIYQMRMTKRGKVPIKMKFYTPSNPNNLDQQFWRNKFRNAMAAWQLLTSEQKTAYNVRAKHIGLFGRNLFIREYYSAN